MSRTFPFDSVVAVWYWRNPFIGPVVFAKVRVDSS